MSDATCNLFVGKFGEQSKGSTSTTTTTAATPALSGDFYSRTFNTSETVVVR